MIAHHCGTENADHAKFCKGCGESLVAADATMAADNRLGKVLVIGALVIAAAAGGAWWMMRGKMPAPVIEGNDGAGTTAPVSHATAQPAAGPGAQATTGAHGKEGAATSAQAPTDAEKRLKREAAARNKAEQETQRKASQEQRRQTAEAARQRAEEARRGSQQVALPADRRTIKQICDERPNAFSRSVCELRECVRPAKADSAECVEMRERNNPVTPGFMN